MTPTSPSLNECWLWAGHFYGSGHGKLYLGGGKAIPAYRAVYESEVGEIPEGLELDHLCENPPCVNSAHLEPVTHQENTRRHYRNKTHCRNGHEYTEENTVYANYNPKGETRRCRECRRVNAAIRSDDVQLSNGGNQHGRI